MSQRERGGNNEGISQALYLKRQSKSWEAFQQSVLMGILVKEGYTFNISVPEKYSNKVSHLFKIITMEKQGELIKIDEIIRNECQKLASLESKKISDASQLKRHSYKNRVSMGLNILLKEIRKHGYDVKKRGTRGSVFTIIAEKFSEISFDQKVYYDKATIRSLGKQINDYLLKKCKSIDKKDLISFSIEDMNQMNQVTPHSINTTPSAFIKKLIHFSSLDQSFNIC
ncbi:hypothetical protein EDI_026860 [Entamoeba dispar SAW760]|uniref:Uncharacterized protein n=1 Tax=Entamoeba dispar (strain ATCC PRA-260 / SAW760) TaxID=370354 RepID=B0EPY5_ENTDS|nr:uncharacterized protein EDI_026860 [Entamoeba dispar SAW760]EDR23454.1 hypothetical protein EDI_026860 [Entamoeba dispar SAW760]|eukprot:EDR23454.1 hypothetical protein EDI_026860 [Entamoeba dispar SAW760]